LREQLLKRTLSGTSQGGKCDRLYRISCFAQDGEELQHSLDLSQLRLHIEKCCSDLVSGSRVARICGLDPVLCRPVRHSVLLAMTSASYWQEVQ
jgi:hypothetical protein